MRTLIFIISTLLSGTLFAQDIHFSQNLISRVSINPSLIGYFSDNDYRISLHRRSQWESVSKPFTTFLMSVEAKKIYKKINLGLEFYNDKSGDANLTKNQINVALSSNLNLYRDNNIMLGASFGFGQKTINNDMLIFEQNETLINNSFLFSDISISASFKRNFLDKYSFIISNSYQHLNRPRNSFNNQENRLSIKNNTYSSISRFINERHAVHLELLHTKQTQNHETLFGIKQELTIKNIKLYQLSYYRMNDAFIVGLGVKKNNIQAKISYDINVSDLKVASENRGGFEFSIVYFFNKKQKIQLEEKTCPKYI